MGLSGRIALKKHLSKIIEEYKIDFTIINGENAADDGKGITKKYSESLYWAFLSKLGNIEKADDLVSELVDLVPEKTVETVREEVKNYLVNSIESGSKTSIMHLGKFFLEVVEEKEYPSAYKWFTVGAALGLENADEMRDNVEEELSPEEIIEEQDNAEKFFKDFVNKNN